jgi:hypothetical protein
VDCGVVGQYVHYLLVDSKVRLVTSCLLSYISYEYDYVLAGAVSVVHAVVPLPNIFS